MEKSCRHCAKPFDIAEEDLEFYEKVSPVFAGKRYSIPPPTLCPDCREQRRLAFRNDRFYYSRNCDLCQKPIISLFDPEHRKNVYCNICWWSERWDPSSYGRDFDFSRPFFEQFKDLLNEVPKITMINDDGVQSVNCAYTSDFSLGKNAYMVLCSWYVEDSMYGFQTNWVKNCVDNLYLLRSELMYESVISENSYNCQHCQQVKESSDCIFGYDLMNCSDCLLSAGLRNKQYCIWNQQYTKEEYFRLKAAFNLDSWEAREKLHKQFSEFILRIPRKFANLIQCDNTTGDNLKRCKDTKYCFNLSELQNCKFMTSGDKAKDCYDCNSTGNPELCYEAVTPDNGYMNAFMADSWNSKYLLYCDSCHNSQNLFGCVGFKKNQYCILNKQYTKEEYEALVPRIIEHLRTEASGEWGEFFSASVAPFAYDETAANEWHPLTQEQAERLGYRWKGKDVGSVGKETLHWNEVPDSIEAFDKEGNFADSRNILQEIVACMQCTKNFKINKQEFDFYTRKSIPLPRLCPNCRHTRRRAKLNPKKLWSRTCICSRPIESTYAPERPEIVCCEVCYLKEIY